MAEKLSEPVIQSLRDAFNLHNHRGYAQTLMDVVTPLRYVGCAATIDEVKSHYTGGPISFSAFLDLYHEIKLDNKQDKQCLKHTLDFLSGNDQWPQKEELLRILTTFGDKIEVKPTTLKKLENILGSLTASDTSINSGLKI
ncbi:unnamed protein product [Calicophoron daubneyi]|uniref:Uncharacterized protein n=1 Tax=Calicophoron daubneyi TaxID=300641 RepID=A0AAV2TP53_CALDB